MTCSDSVFANPHALERVIDRILRTDGCSAAEAGAVAAHLVEASLRGHDSHGVVRIMRYHHWLESGRLKARQSLEPLVDSGALLQFDGHNGIGQWLAQEATASGIDRAREYGVALVALRRAGHIGRLGAYAEQACQAGMLSIQFVNVAGSPLVAPFGAAQRCMSTAPVAIGVPGGGRENDFILDFATSMVSEGKALLSSQGGAALPDGALVDDQGRRTRDPRVLYGATIDTDVPDPCAGTGALSAMGDHKGSGLALACELLAGALTGNGSNGPVERSFGNGLLAIFIDPAHINDSTGFATDARRFIDYVRSAAPADDVEQVFVPGDIERACTGLRQRTGIPLPRRVCDDLLSITEALSLHVSDGDLLHHHSCEQPAR